MIVLRCLIEVVCVMAVDLVVYPQDRMLNYTVDYENEDAYS